MPGLKGSSSEDVKNSGMVSQKINAKYKKTAPKAIYLVHGNHKNNVIILTGLWSTLIKMNLIPQDKESQV